MNKNALFYLTLLLSSLNLCKIKTNLSIKSETSDNVLIENQSVDAFWNSGVVLFIICLEKQSVLSKVILASLKNNIKTTNESAQLLELYLNEEQATLHQFLSSVGLSLTDQEFTQGKLICFKNKKQLFSKNIDAALCSNNNKFKKELLSTYKRSMDEAKNQARSPENVIVSEASKLTTCKDIAVKNSSYRGL